MLLFLVMYQTNQCVVLIFVKYKHSMLFYDFLVTLLPKSCLISKTAIKWLTLCTLFNMGKVDFHFDAISNYSKILLSYLLISHSIPQSFHFPLLTACFLLSTDLLNRAPWWYFYSHLSEEILTWLMIWQPWSMTSSSKYTSVTKLFGTIGILWNSTQNILPIYWKMSSLFRVKV